MNRKIVFIVCLVSLFGIQIVFAQKDTDRPNGFGTPTNREIREKDFNDRREALQSLSNISQRTRSGIYIKAPSKEEIENFEKITAPSEEDLREYKDFLEQSDTGIFRLLPDYDCESRSTISIEGDCANFVSGTWHYSFRKKDYFGDGLQDIVYKRDILSVGGLLNQGVLVSLGTIALEDISLDTDGMKFLADFEPAKDRQTAQKQFEQISKGIIDKGFTYSKQEKLEESTTYAIRVVAYRFYDKYNRRKKTAGNRNFSYLDFDKRKDLLLAFRVIRKSDDGAVTILWKEIKEQKSPKIVFEKQEKLADFKN